MKKICSLVLCLCCIVLITTACTNKPSGSMINAKRRFAEYVEPQNNKPEGVIDLSEGPRLKYDSYFGPKALNFDFKIENPY